MGLNNVLQAHNVGAGAGQDYEDFQAEKRQQQQEAQQNQQAQPAGGLLGSFSDAQLRQMTFLGVVAADILLLLIYLEG